MSPRALGALIAFIVFAVDQAAKAAVLSRFREIGPESTPLMPFLDLALRWNPGISFSLFSQDSPLGQAILLVVTLAATAALGWWLWRCKSKWAAAGLGAIIGGALGNAVDRLAHGAVIDYLDLHALGRHFFVFNLADAAINIGVALLVLDLAFGSQSPSERKQPLSPPRAN
jgi:lipoprotein signal peptidase